MFAVLQFLFVALYIVACGVLIFAVLLQQGKGASLGASLGGGASQTVFGSRGSNFMTRMTAVMAGVFMVLALVLAKWPPFGNDTSSDVRDILTPEEVQAGTDQAAPASAPVDALIPDPNAEPVIPPALPSPEAFGVDAGPPTPEAVEREPDAAPEAEAADVTGTAAPDAGQTPSEPAAAAPEVAPAADEGVEP